MKKSFSIVLSFILLTGHMSFAIGTHFCGGEAVETKILYGKTHYLGCNSPDMAKSCDIPLENDTNEVHIENVPCCENEYQTVQVTDEFVKADAQATFNVEYAIAFIYTSLNFDLFPKSTVQFYTEYISPPLEKDVQVLFQTFLI